MVIRQSTPEDLPEILRLIAAARAFMVERGNPSQWPEGYPSAEQLSSDIARGHSYVCVTPEYAGLVGTFYFAVEEEPSYQHIEGRWLNDKPYGVIHRLASMDVREASFVNASHLLLSTALRSELIPMKTILLCVSFSWQRASSLVERYI